MDINEFLQKYRRVNQGVSVTRPRVKCADGYTVSVQAGCGMYSRPRADADHYSAVELGFPSEINQELMPYYDGSIYGYVPVEIADFVLRKHGGIIGADFSNDIGKRWREWGNDTGG